MVGPRDGKETVILEDEDMVDWHFRANNTKHRKLWGVYVYLKGYGHVWRDDTYWRRTRQPTAGQPTRCGPVNRRPTPGPPRGHSNAR